MSPYEIKLLLDIYTTPSWKDGRNEQILEPTLRSFYGDGLIQGSSQECQLTEKGSMHVVQLCNLPYPVEHKIWIDQYGNRIQATI